MQALFVYLLIINSLAFLANGIDKFLATVQKRRISERNLLGLTFLGGTIGAGVAMLLFRHKTAKKRYLLSFFGIIALQLCLFFAYWKWL